VVKTDETLAAEQRQLLDQLSNHPSSDIKLRRLVDIARQRGQTSLTLPLTTRQTDDAKPATKLHDQQRSTTIHQLSTH